MSLKRLTLLAALAGTLALSGGAQAADVKIGALRCSVSGGLGLVVASTKELNCRFRGLDGRREHYFGSIRKYGLDIGQTDRGVLIWDVFAASRGAPRGGLAGDYGGVGASATVGAGLGAHALVGGLNGAFALQPLSVEAQTGIDLAAGVESLTLRAGP